MSESDMVIKSDYRTRKRRYKKAIDNVKVIKSDYDDNPRQKKRTKRQSEPHIQQQNGVLVIPASDVSSGSGKNSSSRGQEEVGVITISTINIRETRKDILNNWKNQNGCY